MDPWTANCSWPGSTNSCAPHCRLATSSSYPRRLAASGTHSRHQNRRLPHTAIREDASITSPASTDLSRRFPRARPILIDPAATTSPPPFSLPSRGPDDIRHRTSPPGQDPPQRRPRHHPQRPARDQQDRLAPHVGASLEVMDRDAGKMRGSAHSSRNIAPGARASPRSHPRSNAGRMARPT